MIPMMPSNEDIGTMIDEATAHSKVFLEMRERLENIEKLLLSMLDIEDEDTDEDEE